MAENFDIIMSRLGTGKWNYLHFFTIGYCYFFQPAYVMGPVFMGPMVDLFCKVPQEHQLKLAAQNNASTDSECTYSVALENGDIQEHLCKEWDFDNSTFTNTIFSEYNLVCDRSYLHSIYITIFMIGSLVGAPLNALSDKYGRKTMIVVSWTVFSCSSIVTPLLSNITGILIARFLLGTVYVIIVITGYNLVTEVCDPGLRSIVGVTIWMPWVLGTMAWGILGYAVRDWRMLHIIIAVPLFLVFILMWFMDESPRWLAVVGRHKECKRVLRMAARWNNIQLPDEKDLDTILMNTFRDKNDPVFKNITNLYASQNMAFRTGWRAAWDGCMDGLNTFLSLFSTAKLRLRIIITCSNYFLIGIVFWGLSMSGVTFSDDPFQYMILSGLMEAPSFSLWAVVLRRAGRKLPTVGCFITTGVALIALYFVPQDVSWARMLLALIGKLSISCAWAGLDLHSMELFPTELRSLTGGLCSMFSRFGGIIAPLMAILGAYLPWAPSVLFGSSAIVAGLAHMLLPETIGNDLPDTIHDI